jgi:hypothetical protein
MHIEEADGEQKRMRLRRREQEFLKKNLMEAFTEVFREI